MKFHFFTNDGVSVRPERTLSESSIYGSGVKVRDVRRFGRYLLAVLFFAHSPKYAAYNVLTVPYEERRFRNISAKKPSPWRGTNADFRGPDPNERAVDRVSL